jgi:hypothetical protein
MYLICWKISLLLLSRIATRTVSNVSVTYICFILYVPCKLYLDDNCTLFGAEIYDFLNYNTQRIRGKSRLAEHQLLTSSCSYIPTRLYGLILPQYSRWGVFLLMQSIFSSSSKSYTFLLSF